MSLFQRIKTPFTEFVGDQPYGQDTYIYAVGDLLRDRREELQLDLDSIGAALCIKPVYLAALEQGRTEDLPGPAYAAGFIRAYANYLGFDGERVLDAYKAESVNVRVRPDLALPVALSERSVPGGPILMVAAILALCGYGTWYYLSTGERSRPERVAAVPADLQPAPSASAAAAAPAAAVSPPPPAGAKAGAASDQVPAKTNGSGLSSGLVLPGATPPTQPAGTADQTPSGAVAMANAPPAQPSPAGPAAAVPLDASTGSSDAAPAAAVTTGEAGTVDIKAVSDCWIQVRDADQSIVFSRVLKAGETYHVPRTGLMLRTGNAGALAIAVDGKPAPAIGGIGALRRNVSLDPGALLAGTAVHG